MRTNLIAHIRNNLLNETFGICENRYKATPKQKEQIRARKEEVLSAIRECETLEDILRCEAAKPYISAAWLDTPEAMIVRKMRNNAIKKFPKNLNSMACERDVPDPEEYPDGRCKTKKLFQNGTMDFYKVEGYPPYRGY